MSKWEVTRFINFHKYKFCYSAVVGITKSWTLSWQEYFSWFLYVCLSLSWVRIHSRYFS